MTEERGRGAVLEPLIYPMTLSRCFMLSDAVCGHRGDDAVREPGHQRVGPQARERQALGPGHGRPLAAAACRRRGREGPLLHGVHLIKSAAMSERLDPLATDVFPSRTLQVVKKLKRRKINTVKDLVDLPDEEARMEALVSSGVMPAQVGHGRS